MLIAFAERKVCQRQRSPEVCWPAFTIPGERILFACVIVFHQFARQRSILKFAKSRIRGAVQIDAHQMIC